MQKGERYYTFIEGEKNHKKGGLNCVLKKNFSFLRSEKLFPDSEFEIVQSLT